MTSAYRYDVTGVYVEKSSAAVLDYTFDWVNWLNAETISTSSWTADTGISIDTDTNTTTATTVWLSGGEPGKTYRVYNTITTNASRTERRSFRVKVQTKELDKQ